VPPPVALASTKSVTFAAQTTEGAARTAERMEQDGDEDEENAAQRYRPVGSGRRPAVGVSGIVILLDSDPRYRCKSRILFNHAYVMNNEMSYLLHTVLPSL
jgi:hypothetical protein